MNDIKIHLSTAAPSPGRRQALSLAAGVAATLPALLVASCGDEPRERHSPDTEKADGEGDVTANEDLMREHGVLRRILILYREVAPRLATGSGTVNAAAILSAATLFRDFGERYHEQMLEEEHIFPLVRKHGGESAALIDTLLDQHERGRAITAYILDRVKTGKVSSGDGPALAKAMTGFARMYEGHAAREDTLIFPAFRNALGDNAYRELGEQFEEIEHRQFGGDGFDAALEKIASAEAELGLADLAQFTAPAPPK